MPVELLTWTATCCGSRYTLVFPPVAGAAWVMVMWVWLRGDAGPLMPPRLSLGIHPAQAKHALAVVRSVRGRCCSHVCGSFTAALAAGALQLVLFNALWAVVAYVTGSGVVCAGTAALHLFDTPRVAATVSSHAPTGITWLTA